MINIAHIHPMLVHFPIVLFFIAVGVELIVLIRGGDLIGQQCLPRIALSALVLAALAAIVAASFGDMAFDKAIDLGFPRPPLEEHEELGFTTMWFFIGLSNWLTQRVTVSYHDLEPVTLSIDQAI